MVTGCLWYVTSDQPLCMTRKGEALSTSAERSDNLRINLKWRPVLFERAASESPEPESLLTDFHWRSHERLMSSSRCNCISKVCVYVCVCGLSVWGVGCVLCWDVVFTSLQEHLQKKWAKSSCCVCVCVFTEECVFVQMCSAGGRSACVWFMQLLWQSRELINARLSDAVCPRDLSHLTSDDRNLNDTFGKKEEEKNHVMFWEIDPQGIRFFALSLSGCPAAFIFCFTDDDAEDDWMKSELHTCCGEATVLLTSILPCLHNHNSL